MGFAEFASFTCQLDDDTIKEHVTAMVGVSLGKKKTQKMLFLVIKLSKI